MLGEDIGGEIASDGIETADAGDVIGDAVGTILVGADVDADDALAADRLKTPESRLVAVIVEAEAVDDALVFDEAEDARTRIAGLRLWGHRADLGKAETELQQRLRHFGILVVARGHAERIGEISPATV